MIEEREPYETFCSSCGAPLRRIGGSELWDHVARLALERGEFDREKAVHCPLCRQSTYKHTTIADYVIADYVLVAAPSTESRS